MQTYRCFCLCSILLVSLAEGALHRIGNWYEFISGGVTVSIDAGNGSCVGVSLDGRTVLTSLGGALPMPVRLKQDDCWLPTEPDRAHVIKVEEISPETVAVSIAFDEWVMKQTYSVQPEKVHIRRTVEVSWCGAGETKLKGLAMPLPPVPRSDVVRWFSPGAWPPHQRTQADYAPGYRRSFGHSPQPLIVQIGPNRSIVFVNDMLQSHSDNGSVTVSETDDGLVVSPGFNALARLEPQSHQTVGDSLFWVVDTDADSALLRLHELYADIGFVIPEDRPDWFQSAILYSFHPGGTIGSGFRDLGGFKRATGFLNQVADLGCNAIWVMPIEDRAVYHPRDYYKFQEGLGTAEEYRGLVNRAHTLGMHVLQDIVPHGGSNDCPRAIEHPQWLAQEEDGSTLSYWCFDFNWPEWRAYMADVARYYVKEYDVDGYRVDACSGSKIPNWNPNIPYDRASFAKAQGGIHMLSGLREAVKESKPVRGGILAEAGGNVLGTVSDCIYDFDFCYRVLHDLRKRPATEVVPELRRWFHEQEYVGPKGMLRLRHIESHDSLRSQLWYGLQPQRALMALSCFITGIPLVYHEAEDGNRAVFQRLFAIRKALTELNGGAADYLSVQCPPGVFACLRYDDDAVSIVLINLDPSMSAHSNFEISFDRSVLGKVWRERGDLSWYDIGEGRCFSEANRGERVLFNVLLEPYMYHVLRNQPIPEQLKSLPDARLRFPDWTNKRKRLGHARKPVEGSLTTVQSAAVELRLDGETGLPAEMSLYGQRCGGAWDLFLTGSAVKPGSVEVTCGKNGRIVSRRRYGEDRLLQMEYQPNADRIEVNAVWLEGTLPGDVALLIPFDNTRRWTASATEGVFEDVFRPRHVAGVGTIGSIYWRPQGTNAFWDSLLHPFSEAASPAIGILGKPGSLALVFSSAPYSPVVRHRQGADSMGMPAPGDKPSAMGNPIPARIRLLERFGGREEPAALIAWRDRDVPGVKNRSLQFDLKANVTPFKLSEETTGGSVSGAAPRRGLQCVAGGWIFSNSHYSIRISRSGVITELVDEKREKTLVQGGDLYTDAGFAPERDRYSASNDVEAFSRFTVGKEGPRMEFSGCLRGFHRFDKKGTPVEYRVSYRLGQGPSFRMSWAVKPDGNPHGERAFVSLFLPSPGLSILECSRDGVSISKGLVGDGSQRVGETKLLPGKPIPDAISVYDTWGPLYRITDISCSEGAISNVFAHGAKLFLTFLDDACVGEHAGAWKYAEGVVTVGNSDVDTDLKPLTPSYQSEPVLGSVVVDGGFEGNDGSPVSPVSGMPFPAFLQESPWQVPSGGKLTRTEFHTGNVCAEVVGRKKDYRLWRQRLGTDVFPVGSRWKLSAWVKGKDIQQGDMSWQVGTVRFAVTTNKTSYASSRPLTGTFDWTLIEVEWTVPEEVRHLEIQAGQNGSSGRLWIDDVRLEQMPGE